MTDSNAQNGSNTMLKGILAVSILVNVLIMGIWLGHHFGDDDRHYGKRHGFHHDCKWHRFHYDWMMSGVVPETAPGMSASDMMAAPNMDMHDRMADSRGRHGDFMRQRGRQMDWLIKHSRSWLDETQAEQLADLRKALMSARVDLRKLIRDLPGSADKVQATLTKLRSADVALRSAFYEALQTRLAEDDEAGQVDLLRHMFRGQRPGAFMHKECRHPEECFEDDDR